MNARFTRLDSPSETGCTECDTGLPTSLRAYCGRCRITLTVPRCVLCGDKGWRSAGFLWGPCECRVTV